MNLMTLSETLLQRLERSPIGQELRAEDEAEKQERRSALFSQRAATLSDDLAAVPARRKTLTATLEDVRKAEAVLKEKRRLAENAQGEISAASFRLQRELHVIDQELIALAPAELAADLERLDTMLEATRTGAGQRGEILVDTKPGYEPRRVPTSDWQSRQERLKAIRVAQQRIAELQLTALEGEALNDKRAAIFADIPELALEMVAAA